MPGQTPERLYTSSLKSTDVYGLTSYSPIAAGGEVLGRLQAGVGHPHPILASWQMGGNGVIMGIEGRPQIPAPITPAQSMDLPD